MTEKEIKRLDNRIDDIKEQINNRITIAFVVVMILALFVFGIWLSLANTEWQCIPDEWEETDELVGCKSEFYDDRDFFYISVNDSDLMLPFGVPKLDGLCEDEFGDDWSLIQYGKASLGTFCNPFDEGYAEPCSVFIVLCEKFTEIVNCEHKKVCTQEMLVRNVT